MNEFSYRGDMMGTDVSLSFVCRSATVAEKLAEQSFATIRQYEERFSRFLDSSELTVLNTLGTLVISEEFNDVLQASIQLHHLTAGAFNPLVQVSALGYVRTYEQLRGSVSASTEEAYSADVNQLTHNSDSRVVSLGTRQQLDFGGMLKGYLSHRIADDVMAQCSACSGCIINIGGDLTTRGRDALHQPFMFELYNPVRDRELSVPVLDASLATSGTYARRWNTVDGQRHHIVDASTQLNPDTPVVAVSIVHRDGAVAEALTKLFLVKGYEAALAIQPPTRLAYHYFVVFDDGQAVTNLNEYETLSHTY